MQDAHVDAYASSGVADWKGGFGYVIYVRLEDAAPAMAALESVTSEE